MVPRMAAMLREDRSSRLRQEAHAFHLARIARPVGWLGRLAATIRPRAVVRHEKHRPVLVDLTGIDVDDQRLHPDHPAGKSLVVAESTTPS